MMAFASIFILVTLSTCAMIGVGLFIFCLTKIFGLFSSRKDNVSKPQTPPSRANSDNLTEQIANACQKIKK